MPKRRQTIEIYDPVLGMKSDAPSDILDPRSQPAGQNMKLYFGVNQKEWGTSLYATATNAVLGAPINLLYEAAFTSASILEVLTATSVSKYTQAADTFISDGQLFTGSFTDFWSGVMHNGAFIYSNGVNPIQVKTTLASTGTNMGSAVSPSTYLAWQLQSIHDHLCLYHTFENGTEFPTRVQWSKNGLLTYATGTADFASGVAGALDIQDCEGLIRAAAPLFGSVMIYSDRSIHTQYWVGGDEVFRFTKTISGVGTPSRRGVVSFGEVNFFFSRNNVYAYYGGTDLRPIGEPVRKIMFSEADPANLEYGYIEFDDTEYELRVHLPVSTSPLSYNSWVYRVSDDSWARLKRDYTAAAKFSRKTGLTIGEMTQAIGNYTLTFGDAYTKVEAPVRLYGDQTGRVVKNDKTVYSLSSSGTTVAQPFIYETPDLTGQPSKDPADQSPTEFVTTTQDWQKIMISMKGNGVASVLWSTDFGVSFTECDDSPVTLSPSGTVHEMDVAVSSPTLRTRITCTGTNDWVGLDYIKLNFLPGPAY